MVESSNPSKSYFPDNVVHANANITTTGDHANTVADIIFSMAPECTIYSYPIGSNGTLDNIINNAEILIKNYNVKVVNISAGVVNVVFNEAAANYVRSINQIIINKNVNICIAAGNGLPSSAFYMNILGYAANAITVGSIQTSGTSLNSPNAYSLYQTSLYNQPKELINKPDICAPGFGHFVGYPGSTCTSFATPRVTGTIIQMLSRNPWMTQQSLKAAVLASGTFKPTGFESDIEGTIFSTKSGAGVVDAGFCLKVAGNGRRAEHTFTSTSTWKTSVYADYTDKPFRIAATWNVLYDAQEKQMNPEINLRLTKNGKVVARSTANSNVITGSAVPELDYGGPCTNYEVIELSPEILKQYGAGTYELTIYHVGSYKGPVTVGAAWEQW